MRQAFQRLHMQRQSKASGWEPRGTGETPVWTSSRLETVGGMWYHTGDFWKGALSPLNGKRL